MHREYCLLAAAALLCAACGAGPSPAVEAARACEPVHAIAGPARPITIRLPDDTPPAPADRVVISLLDRATAQIVVDEGRVPLQQVMPFIRHARVFEVDRGPGEATCGYVAPKGTRAATADATPVAFSGFGDDSWGALLGRGGRELVGAADESGAVALHGFDALTATASAPRRGHCEGPRFVHLAGDDPAHHACALLPEGHDPALRYPAVYMLSGLAGDDTNRFGWSGFVDMADRLAAESDQPALYIGVNGRSPHGSIYPSEARGGPWLDWISRDLPAAAEARLGADPAAAGLFGQSTGGFNAITVALLRPGPWRAVAVSAPDGLDLGFWLLDESGGVRPDWLAWMRLEAAVGGAGQMVSYAAAWSPDGEAMPADLVTGAVRRDVLDAWLAHSPLVMLDAPAGRAAMAALDGRLHLAVAGNDEFGLARPLQRFAARLHALDIAHGIEIDQHGHFGLDKRLPRLMQRLLADLAPGPAP